ncbi:MAG: hypothetical protein ACR2MN_13265 [Acidimicrobiales bacterium]
MNGNAEAGQPADLLPRRLRWLPLVVFVVFVAIGLASADLSPPVAVPQRR